MGRPLPYKSAKVEIYDDMTMEERDVTPHDSLCETEKEFWYYATNK